MLLNCSKPLIFFYPEGIIINVNFYVDYWFLLQIHLYFLFNYSNFLNKSYQLLFKGNFFGFFKLGIFATLIPLQSIIINIITNYVKPNHFLFVEIYLIQISYWSLDFYLGYFLLYFIDLVGNLLLEIPWWFPLFMQID